MTYPMKKIKSFANVITGGTPSTKKPEYWNGTIPWLPSGCCQNCRVNSADTFITEEGLKHSAAKLMPINTVLIALTGATTGKVGLLGIEACANQSVTGIMPNEQFYPEYLFYYLISIRDKIIFDSYGGAQKHISQGYVKDLNVPLPDIQVQIQIATVLEKMTSLISKRKEQIALLDKLAKDMFVDMFDDPSTFQNSKEAVLLGSLGTFKNGMNYRNGDKGHKIKCLGVGDFKSRYNIFDVTTLSNIELESEPSEEYILHDNDIVFVRSNGNKALVGRCVLVYPGDQRLTFSGFCIRFRVTDQRILPEYLNHMLHLPSTKNVLFESIRGCNIQNLNQKMLSSLRIYLPPIQLQEQFIHNIQNLQKKIAQLELSLAELETTYKATLQKAFNGELF